MEDKEIDNQDILDFLQKHMVTKTELRDELDAVCRRLDYNRQQIEGVKNRLDVVDDRWRQVDSRLQAVENA